MRQQKDQKIERDLVRKFCFDFLAGRIKQFYQFVCSPRTTSGTDDSIPFYRAYLGHTPVLIHTRTSYHTTVSVNTKYSGVRDTHTRLIKQHTKHTRTQTHFFFFSAPIPTTFIFVLFNSCFPGTAPDSSRGLQICSAWSGRGTRFMPSSHPRKADQQY